MYTFITRENQESKKAKDINENLVNDELKYEDYKKKQIKNRSYKRHEANRIESKDHITGLFLCLLTMTKIYT